MTDITAWPYGPLLKQLDQPKGITLVETDAGEECIIADLYDNYLNGDNRIHRFSALFQHAGPMETLLQEVVSAWPQFDNNAEVSGAELIAWFAAFRSKTKDMLLKIKQAEQLSCTDEGIQSLQACNDPS